LSRSPYIFLHAFVLAGHGVGVVIQNIVRVLMRHCELI
jgi:hypothetical protein